VKTDDYGNPIKRTRQATIVSNFDIIGPEFWEKHQYILGKGQLNHSSFRYAFGPTLIDFVYIQHQTASIFGGKKNMDTSM
jgi:hypothetical protein